MRLLSACPLCLFFCIATTYNQDTTHMSPCLHEPRNTKVDWSEIHNTQFCEKISDFAKKCNIVKNVVKMLLMLWNMLQMMLSKMTTGFGVHFCHQNIDNLMLCAKILLNVVNNAML